MSLDELIDYFEYDVKYYLIEQRGGKVKTFYDKLGEEKRKEILQSLRDIKSIIQTLSDKTSIIDDVVEDIFEGLDNI